MFLEADLPTEHPQAEEDPWFSHTHAQPWWARRPAVAPGPRAEKTLRLIWRVRDRATFQALARAPRRRAGGIALRSCCDGSASPPRVAFAVGRRAGSSVVRNRIRRRLRAAVDRCRAELVPGGAYLFEADRSVLTTAFADLAEAVATLVRGTRPMP